MSRALVERNKFILENYDPERRNGQEIADRFGISRVRVGQIYRQELERKGVALKTRKYDGLIPSFTIEKEREIQFRNLAEKLHVSTATLLRWSVYAMLEKQGSERVEPESLKEG